MWASNLWRGVCVMAGSAGHKTVNDQPAKVLASYRLAQGEDVVTGEDREVAEHMLRRVTPALAR